MANENIKITVSDNNENISLRVLDNNSRNVRNIDNHDPYYVGAKANVTQTDEGAVITCEDKTGTTTATVLHGAQGEKGEKGDKGDTGTLPLYTDTTEAWNSQRTLIGEAGAMYVYTDHKQVGGVNVSGIKLGDGTSYLIDIPFIDASFDDHASNTIVHITQEEREFWNSKNRAFLSGENLILTEL